MARTFFFFCVFGIIIAFIGSTTATGSSTATGNSTATDSTTTGTPGSSTTAGNSTASDETSSVTSIPTVTIKPGTTTATGNSTAADSTTTGTPGSSATAGNSTASNETSSVTSIPPVTIKPDPCDSNPCRGGSTCEARANNTFICLCLPGDSYIEEDNICQRAKVFPGQLSLSGLTYNSTMSQKTSAAFKEASDRIINAMEDIFKNNTAYIGCVVLEFREKQTRMTRANEAEAVVDLSFSSESNVTEETVKTSIKNCEGCGVTFVAKDLCEKSTCDKTSTQCAASDGIFSCSCQDGYIKSNYADRVCLACSAGKKAVDSESCEKCDFGYSGFNCSENWQLILVIVGVVLGGLALIFLISLIIVSVKSPKKKFKKSDEAEDVKPYISHYSTKAPLGGNGVKNNYTSETNAPAGVPRIPRIPRATTTLDNRSNMEMMQSNSRQNLISSSRDSWVNEDQDGPYSRPNNSYAQNRPQSNPYNQNRAQYNPYAQSQDHSNPYFSSDRFN